MSEGVSATTSWIANVLTLFLALQKVLVRSLAEKLSGIARTVLEWYFLHQASRVRAALVVGAVRVSFEHEGTELLPADEIEVRLSITFFGTVQGISLGRTADPNEPGETDNLNRPIPTCGETCWNPRFAVVTRHRHRETCLAGEERHMVDAVCVTYTSNRLSRARKKQGQHVAAPI